MAQVGTNATGQPVFVGDQCTVTGVVASTSGSGRTGTVVVTTDKNDSISVKGQDCISVEVGGPIVPAGTTAANYTLDTSASSPVISNDGNAIGANNQVAVRGTVFGYISGAGSTSQLSIKLADTGSTVTVTAACLRSVPSQAGNLV